MDFQWGWTRIIAERKIKDAIDNGEFDDVPGKGEPLQLDENPFLTLEQRITNRILKNAQALPEWLQAEKDIEREQATVPTLKARTLRAIQLGRNTATRERIANRLRGEHRERMDMINTLIMKYNFIAPASAQKAFRPYNLRQEMVALEDEIRGAGGPAASDAGTSKAT